MNNHEILSLKVLYLEKKTDSDITSILTLYVHVEQVAICQANMGTRSGTTWSVSHKFGRTSLLQNEVTFQSL